ncbi:IS1634 family transposase, partial [Facilibium subflavum]|uniref:IS1634 family transposase n=1 Tax=Facilibium subflavum TaxID=2219058 RepID=UPI001AAE0465
ANPVMLEAVKAHKLNQRSCYVIGTNTVADELSAKEVLEAYKNQNNSVERGFRFLKDPQFFVSSFFVKKPARIMSLLMVMTLSLLIYSVAQKHLREQLAIRNETLPNQINQPVTNPTMRWVFQMLEGVHVVYIAVKGQILQQITGITDIKRKILEFFYTDVQEIYHLEKV